MEPVDHESSEEAAQPAKSTAEVVSELLGSEAQSPAELVVPAEPGIYAWWCRTDRLGDSKPGIPREPRLPMSDEWSLLYVGISPSNARSESNLSDRLLGNHLRGRIGGSTFRKSLAALLFDHLGLEAWPGADRARLLDEGPLTRWMHDAAGVTFAVQPEPWLVEGEVISALNPPLNLRPGHHGFRHIVSELRKDLEQKS